MIIGSMAILPSMYQSTILGTSVRALGAAKGRAFPDPAGDKLERTGGDFLAGFGDADDDALAPAAMAGFQRRAHHLGVAGAVEGVIGAAIGQRHQMRHERPHPRTLRRIDKMRSCRTGGPILPCESLRSTPMILSAPTILQALEAH